MQVNVPRRQRDKLGTMRGTRGNRWPLVALATLVAFAQFAMATEPCRLAHEPVRHEMAADDHCQTTPMDPASCLAQCLGQDEGVSSVSPIFDAVITSAPVPAFDFSMAAADVTRPVEPFVPPGSRPLQILYCTYLS